MQHCQYCGSEFPDSASFCGNCGRAPASNVALDTASSPLASSPEASMPTVGSSQLPQGNQPLEEDEEERRRRGAILPLPAPPWAEGSLTGGQVPQVQGTPSLSGVPSVQGPLPQIAGSASPTQLAGLPGSASKAAIGATTKWILIAIAGLLVVAGAATAIVFASHSPGTRGTTPAPSGKSTPTSSNHNASATACASSPGVLCSGTASPSSSVTSGQSTGTFSFAGAIPGPLTITSFPACGLQGSTYVMQVIGTVGGAQYKFLIGILSYAGPSTYTSHLTVNLIRIPTTSLSELSNDGRLPVSITITNGGKAGTVSSDLEGILNGSPQLLMGHVSGKWTCV